MAQKLILVMIILVLSMVGKLATVYASEPRPIDNLDNRYETENVAGITWDQINEMSQNSPNSLTPIQGLVLWMFAIIAFLKLAQKMDNLLQSLGLNVTQTGGRAVGDLIMAGIALRHVGSAISKGMGMVGFGKNGGSPTPGGSSGTSSGIGTVNAAGTGSMPIPTIGPRGSHAPGSINSSGDPTSGVPISAGNSEAVSAVSMPSSTVPLDSSNSPSHSPIGKAVDWMQQDGFAQGAIKAGVKGGAIGLGAYTAKAGVSKIGDAASVHFGDKRTLPDPHGDFTFNNSDMPPSGQSTADIANQNITEITSAYSSENLDGYQNSSSIDSADNSLPIPSDINNEAYYSFGDDIVSDGSAPTSFNNDDFNDISDGSAYSNTEGINGEYVQGDMAMQNISISSEPSIASSESVFITEESQVYTSVDSTQVQVPTVTEPASILQSNSEIKPQTNNGTNLTETIMPRQTTEQSTVQIKANKYEANTPIKPKDSTGNSRKTKSKSSSAKANKRKR